MYFVKIGKWIKTKDHRQLKVIAIAEGWYMARFKGAMPFVIYHQDFETKYGLQMPQKVNQ
jgi:hypothetical protein